LPQSKGWFCPLSEIVICFDFYRRFARWAGPALLCFIAAVGSFAAEPSPEHSQFFEAKIRPILVENCQRCHGEKKQSGSLRLDSLAAALGGGDGGPAVVPGDPEKSPMIEAINYGGLEMPPDARLKPEQIKLLTEWVKIGAPWPGSSDAPLVPRKTSLVVTDADREWWSFQPVSRSPLPTIQNPTSKIQNSIDHFILNRLAEKGLSASPAADRRTLIRRLSFDLTGLPPTLEEVAAFENDSRPDAYERLVDRLLASPQYGERWARHWLDVVRFAQTNGYERDGEKPLAWRYRDYAIRAFNLDKPYDQFLIEQLAGDELESVTDDSLSATGYYRLGVWDDEPDDGKQAKADEFDDIVSTTASAMLGLTLGCARCHDHKFDPLGQEDYYSFTAFFQNIHLYGKVADVVGGGQPVDKEGIFRKLPSGEGETLCVRERDTAPPKSFVFTRGNAHTPGKEVQPRFIEVACRTSALAIPQLERSEASTPSTRGRRLTLATWIASRDNPLTARVAVNRLWQHHFGRGLVATSSDFGHTGTKPSHPELLDYLASEFTDSGWQVKRMQRAIVCSSTYRQSSQISDLKLQIADSNATNLQSAIVNPQSVDPDNTLLWRQNLRRLEAEAIRDAVLFASGELNLQMGGRGVFPTLPPEVLAKQSRPGSGWDKSPADQQARRSVYIYVKRTLGVPLLESFDSASTDTPTALRNITTVAPQALIMLNSDFLNQQAAALARRTKGLACCDPSSQVEGIYEFALGREPSQREIDLSLNFLQRWNDHDERTVAELCKLILNLNEFVYID
jgi:mono/diheme cytochrome c family protein